MESWDILVRGHRMILTVGTAHPPHGADMVANTTNCTIYSYGGDESASIEALRKWAGVPPAPGAAFTEFYTFRQHGAAHLPVAKQDEHAAEDTRRSLAADIDREEFFPAYPHDDAHTEIALDPNGFPLRQSSS